MGSSRESGEGVAGCDEKIELDMAIDAQGRTNRGGGGGARRQGGSQYIWNGTVVADATGPMLEYRDDLQHASTSWWAVFGEFCSFLTIVLTPAH